MSKPGKVGYWRNAYIAVDEKAGALGERAHAAEEKVARVRALADEWAVCDSEPDLLGFRVDPLRAALADAPTERRASEHDSDAAQLAVRGGVVPIVCVTHGVEFDPSGTCPVGTEVQAAVRRVLALLGPDLDEDTAARAWIDAIHGNREPTGDDWREAYAVVDEARGVIAQRPCRGRRRCAVHDSDWSRIWSTDRRRICEFVTSGGLHG
jgi:hypothetical protein